MLAVPGINNSIYKDNQNFDSLRKQKTMDKMWKWSWHTSNTIIGLGSASELCERFFDNFFMYTTLGVFWYDKISSSTPWCPVIEHNILQETQFLGRCWRRLSCYKLALPTYPSRKHKLRANIILSIYMISRVLIDVMNYVHLYSVFSYFAVWLTKLSHFLNHITVLNQLWTFHISTTWGPSMCINDREKM